MMREGPQLGVAKAARAPPCTLPILGRRLSGLMPFVEGIDVNGRGYKCLLQGRLCLILYPGDFDDFLVVGGAEDDFHVALMHLEVLCEQFADGLVRGAFHGGRLHFDLEASVGLRGHAFALAPRMYLDVDAHARRGRSRWRIHPGLPSWAGWLPRGRRIPSGRFPWRRGVLLARG